MARFDTVIRRKHIGITRITLSRKSPDSRYENALIRTSKGWFADQESGILIVKIDTQALCLWPGMTLKMISAALWQACSTLSASRKPYLDERDNGSGPLRFFINPSTTNSYFYGTAKNVLSNPVAAIGGNLHISYRLRVHTSASTPDPPFPTSRNHETFSKCLIDSPEIKPVITGRKRYEQQVAHHPEHQP